MNFVWAGDRFEINQQRIFYINIEKKIDRLEICAVDNYQVFFDGNFICYGPERTAAGYSRKRIIKCSNVKKIEIKVLSYNIETNICDKQLPFFGAEIFNANELVYSSEDFSCKIDLLRDKSVPRYSIQRGYIEKQLLQSPNYLNLPIYIVDSPIIINGIGDMANYQEMRFKQESEGNFTGFEMVHKPWWENDSFSIENDILPKGNYKEINYSLSMIKTGFLNIDLDVKSDGDVFIVFEEILENNKWHYARNNCNDLFILNCKQGNFNWISSEPYSMKYIKVIYNNNITIKPSLVLYENSHITFNNAYKNNKIQLIIDAAKNTFSQNAVDIFTDCPGRERAGWLCDSFFMGKSEKLFMGRNLIERCFLENFIISKTDDIPKGMIPMCFPAEQRNGLFIPNWAMWFVIELKDYFNRTGDIELVNRAKSKVYNLVDYFNKFKNSFNLLEDLEGWVFIEWSIANSKEYIKGINFPTNMLYSEMVKCAGELYCDNNLINESEVVRKSVIKYSFNGKMFIDNAKTINGKIVNYDNHVSETCQYYALFFNIIKDKEYSQFIKENFGPNRKKGFENIGKSNMFIGHLLRLFWLYQQKEYELVINESIEYFYDMAKTTGTLWEYDSIEASLNHGFASSIAVLLDNSLKMIKQSSDSNLKQCAEYI